MHTKPPAQQKKIIGITLGDPSGIGPEVTAKALAKPSVRRLGTFKIIGHADIFYRFTQRQYKNCTFVDIPKTGRIHIGQPSSISATSSINFLHKALELLKNREMHGLVTAPVSKEAICQIGYNFQGHTEFLANAFGVKNFDMMFLHKNIRVVIVTRHMPLHKVPRALTPQKILQTIELTNDSLKKHFRIRHPYLAMTGLNPHAGEGGKMGTEEITQIKPAMQMATKKGIKIDGPFAADTLFCPKMCAPYDAIISMYHDQGLIGIKALYFNKLVNMTIGLPFIRTSPPHGTAYNIAGKNKADASAMAEAIKLAAILS